MTTRDAVLAAALAVFTEYTYGGTRIAQVAAAAEVAVGTIYRHFPSKEALGNAVYRQWKTQMLVDLRAAAGRAGVAGADSRAMVLALWRSTLDFAVRHPDAFRFLEYQQHGSYLDADARKVTDEIDAMCLAAITRGQAAGDIRAGDPGMLIAMLLGALVGLTRAYPGAPVPEAALAVAEQAVWAMLTSEAIDRS